jgi:hypothetical protein
MNRIVSTIAVALALILAQPVIAHAAEIKVLDGKGDRDRAR